jgi:hypothetical protein
MLAHLVGSWDNPPYFEKDWQNKPLLDQIAQKAIIGDGKTPEKAFCCHSENHLFQIYAT